MNNLVLYKAKRKDNGELIESVSINSQTDVNGKEHIYMGVPVLSEMHPKMKTVAWKEVDPATLCKPTGLTDKNGKPIWQYNECRLTVLPFNIYPPQFVGNGNKTARGYIDFIDGAFVFVEYIYHTVIELFNLHNRGYAIEVVVDWYDEDLAKTTFNN